MQIIDLIKEGKIREHTLRSYSTIKREDIEKKEVEEYKRFCKTRLFYNIVNLR